jgi:tRNA-2-methylthio-N6-dimethylallyladenosine synthase
MNPKVIDENKQGATLTTASKSGNNKKLFIESYGCQMNFSDSEIVASILADQGYNTTNRLEEADLVLVNTCSIRDKAEQTVRKRLEKYNAVKKNQSGHESWRLRMHGRKTQKQVFGGRKDCRPSGGP